MGMLDYLNNRLIILETEKLNKNQIIKEMVDLVSENTKYVIV